ncbi:RHTO0S01e05974g1_1 [Rhodotorula toruloides]|uniref:ferroxidase n=1 Tax=Rhodotorula toruloides TaxID=5286 RepID=A0A061ADW8_RHOTO|nr:RHTO0S01e05974g1_1 [Rhodotorula toruloides]
MNRCASSVRSALARPASRAVRTAFSRPAAISSSPFLRSAFSATARPQSVPVCRCFSSTPSRLGNEPGKYKIGQLSDREYHDVSNAAMDHLTEYLEEKLDELDVDGSDVEYSSGVLTVKLGDRGTYVINKQPPNKQIWLSSPISGPKRYDYDLDHRVWFYHRDGDLMHDLLNRELRELLGDETISVDLAEEED